MPKTILVTCPTCQGSGQAELLESLRETLQTLRKLKHASAEELASAMNWMGTRSAMNQRLEDLRSLNLVKRERQGRNFIYSPTEAGA